MSILITSASAKLRLVDAFQQAALSVGSKIIAVDCDSECLAAKYADHFYTIKKDYEKGYAQALLEMCRAHDIALIIPTRDGELIKLASMQQDFDDLGVLLPLPTIEMLEIILDKSLFYEFCLAHNFPVYQRYIPDENAPWPLFVRDRHAAGGMGSREIKNYQDWQNSGLSSENALCQPVSHDTEYSIDVFLLFDSEAMQAVARQRCVVVGGESKVGLIVDNPELCELAKALCEKLGLKGHNIVQAFCSADNDIHIIEVNARFGGGSMMSVAAGMNSPAWLLRICDPEYAAYPEKIQKVCKADIAFGTKLSEGESGSLKYIMEKI